MKHDSATDTHKAKAEPGYPEFKAKVAEPVMKAVDSMPPEWRHLVHEFGYVETYLLWRKRMTIGEAKLRLMVPRLAQLADMEKLLDG